MNRIEELCTKMHKTIISDWILLHKGEKRSLMIEFGKHYTACDRHYTACGPHAMGIKYSPKL